MKNFVFESFCYLFNLVPLIINHYISLFILPPRFSFSNHVSTESRNGMKLSFLPFFFSVFLAFAWNIENELGTVVLQKYNFWS